MTIFRQGQPGFGGLSKAFGAGGTGPFNPLSSSGGGGATAFQYVTAANTVLIVGDNVIETSLNPTPGILPPLSSVPAGSSVYVTDGSSDMATNNYTVEVDASDNASGIIVGIAAGVDSIALSNSDQISKFTSLGVGNGWRLIYYGI